MRILKEAPAARLMLRLSGKNNSAMRQRVTETLASFSIASERLDLLDTVDSQADHLQRYHAIDIALDPFPYNGTTTNCDALWMGVPVVTLAGRTHVSRVGTSQLSNLGLTELIAQTPEDYVRIAVQLAQDPERLTTLRAGLRARMAASPLMDAARFTRHLEAAYRQMWQRWCETGV
jgi:predicted O-linked N-acetylglucosamine transferase (SPINDLY family)